MLAYQADTGNDGARTGPHEEGTCRPEGAAANGERDGVSGESTRDALRAQWSARVCALYRTIPSSSHAPQAMSDTPATRGIQVWRGVLFSTRT